MKTEPLALALREIAHTRRLLKQLIVSSESFRYLEAKQTLKALDRKVRTLAKLQARLQKQTGPGPLALRPSALPPSNVALVDFRPARY